MLGLVTASIQLDTKRTILSKAFAELGGDEDRFWDWGVGEDINLESDMRDKLKFDGLIIVPNKKDNNKINGQLCHERRFKND